MKSFNGDNNSVGNAININPIKLTVLELVRLNKYPAIGLIDSAANAAKVVTNPVSAFSNPSEDEYAGTPTVAMLKPRKPKAFIISIII